MHTVHLLTLLFVLRILSRHFIGAITVLTASAGEASSEVAKAHNSLGNVLQGQRRLEDARAEYTTAIGIYVRSCCLVQALRHGLFKAHSLRCAC